MKGKNKVSYFTIFKWLVLMLQKNKKAFYGAIFLSLLKTTFSVATSIGLGVVIQNGFLGEKPDFIYLAVGSLLIFLGYTFYFVAYIISQKIILKITYNVGYSIRQLFFDKIRKMPFKIVEQAARGDLISKGTTDTNALAINLSVCIGDIFTAPLVIIGVLVGLLIISPLLTFITLVFYIVLISVSLTVSLKATPKYMKMQEEVGKLNGVVEEYVTGRKAVKSFGYEQKAMELFSKVN